jgi:hypothetical protein
MNGLQVIRTVTDSISFDQMLRLDLERTGAGIIEQRNIDPKQISNGSSAAESLPCSVPAHIADKLNEIPNPDRNGLILLWSYQIYKIYSGREAGMMDFLNHLYSLGEIQYSTVVKKSRKQEADESDFTITLEKLNLPIARPESMSNTNDSEYERLRRFVSQCMLPSMAVFQQRWATTILNKNVNFTLLALNLLKGTREVSLVNQSG